MTARIADSGVANGMDMAAKRVVWPAPAQLLDAGIGMSVGVRGARVSVGPRGTYVHVGAGGLRYSRRLDKPAAAPEERSPQSRTAPSAAQPVLPGRSVEILDPRQLVDSSPDELLDEIRRKQQIIGIVPVVLISSVAGLLLFLLLLGSQARTPATIGCWRSDCAGWPRCHGHIGTIAVPVSSGFTMSSTPSGIKFRKG